MSQKEDSAELSRSVYSGVKWLGLAMGASQLVRLLTTIVLARLLLQEHFGLVTLSTTAIYAISTFREIGFGQALVNRPAGSPEELRRAANTAFWIVQVTNVAMFTVGWLAAPSLAAFYDKIVGVEPVLRALLVVFLVEGLSVVSAALLQKELRFEAISRNEMRATLCYGVVAISCAFAGFGVWSLVAGQLVSRALQVSGLIQLSGWRPAFEFSPPVARELFHFGRWLWLNAILQVVHRSADKLVLGKFAGSAELGAYGIASGLCTAPAKPAGNIVVRIFFPTMSRMQGDLPQVVAAYRSGLGLVSLVTLPAMAGMILVAPDFATTVYGARWEDLGPLIRILSIYGACLMLGALTRPVLLALGRTREITLIGAGRQVLMLALLPWLGPRGGEGVAWAVTLPTILSLVVAHMASVRASRGSQRDVLAPQLRVVAATAVMVVSVLALHAPIESLTWTPVRLAARVAVGVAAYLVATRFLNPGAIGELIRRSKRVAKARGDVPQAAAADGTTAPEERPSTPR